MRLTFLLNSFRREFIGPIPKHKGNVHIGKKRFVAPVTLGKKIALFGEFVHEEQVMKYLSKSYITEEQESKYLDSIQRSHPPYWDDFTRRPIQTPQKQTYSADFIEKLDICRSMEPEN